MCFRWKNLRKKGSKTRAISKLPRGGEFRY